jgi:hypothetical protein
MRLSGHGFRPWLFVAAIVLLSVADILSTVFILRHGGREANAAMAWLMSSAGPWWPVVKIVATAAVSVWIVARWDHWRARFAMAVVACLMCAVVAYNLAMVAICAY